jgi:phenylpropionate dioxygenase-like ring-hydroxylating dioxygenase large terminal subunit
MLDPTSVLAASAGVNRPVAEASTLAPAAYRDPAFLAAETALLRRSWVGIGRADRFDARNAYLAETVAGVPVVLTRDGDGVLRGFANSCRHRGSKLVDDGAGGCNRLICPFHGWSYALDGVLRSAGHMAEAAGFDRAQTGLVPVAVAEHAGFLFVNVSGDAGPVDDWLGDFDAIHTPWPLKTLVSARRNTFEVGCNWKLFLEVFNEYYHLAMVHKGTIGGFYDPPDPPEAAAGAIATQFGTHGKAASVAALEADKTLPAMPGLTGRAASGTRYTWVFPSLAFAASVDCAWSLEAYPIAPDRTRCAATVMFPPETAALADFDARAAVYFARMDAAMAEDVAALERQQAGLESPLARPGRFSPTMEPNVHAFQKWLVGALSAAAPL